MWALIQHLVQSFGAERLGDEDAVILLVLVIVIRERLAHNGVDFFCRHGFDLLGSEDLCHGGVQRRFPFFAEIPERRMQIVSVMYHRDHRHLVHANELAERLRQIRQRAAGGIPRFRIHRQNIAAFENAVDGFNEVQIHGEFARADRTDEFQ